MKKNITISVILFLLVSINVYSQDLDIEIGISGGYMMSTRLYAVEGDAVLLNKPSYGGFANVGVSNNIKLEVFYESTDTEAEYQSDLMIDPQLFDLSIEYYQLSGIWTYGEFETVVPFSSISAGLTRFHLKNTNEYDDELKFSLTSGIGVKFYVSERVGLQTQIRLYMPFSTDGRGIFWVSNLNPSRFSLKVPVVQFNLSAGVFIRL